MSKRQKFVIATIILALGIVGIRYPFIFWRFRIILFSIFAWSATLWALYDRDFKGVDWFTVPTLPALFAIGGAMVFPLLPSNFENFLIWPISYDSGLILAFGLRMIYVALFAVGYYAILLTANIYNVAAIRTIQLLRAAHSIGFIISLFTAICFYLVVGSLHLSSLANFVFTFVISLPIVLTVVWSVELEAKLSRRVLLLSLLLSLCLAEVAWAISFWPISIAVFALLLGSIYYVFVGVCQYYLSERLFGTTIQEFLLVTFTVILLVVFTTSWSG